MANQLLTAPTTPGEISDDGNWRGDTVGGILVWNPVLSDFDLDWDAPSKTVTNAAGTNAVLTDATETDSGLMSAADKTTLIDNVIPLSAAAGNTTITLNRFSRVDDGTDVMAPTVVADKWWMLTGGHADATYDGDPIYGVTLFAHANDGATAWVVSRTSGIATTTQGLLIETGAYDGDIRHVTGYYAAGDGISLTYEWDATSAALDDGVDATHPGLVITPTGHVGNGRWIARINNGVINAKWLGALGDGVQDDQPYIQRAIDLCIYGTTLWSIDWQSHTVELPPGRYLTNDTIHLGYGETFHHVNLISGQPVSEYINNQGPIIEATFVDKPTINIQGGRRNVVQGLKIEGPVTTASTLLRAETDESLWDAIYDTTVPSCGIAIDAYGGADPGGTPGVDKYADATYPAGLSLSQWNKNATGQPTIRDCRIRYFASGIVVSPSLNNFGNADFVKALNTQIQYCKFGITSNESQNRMTTAENCILVDCFAAMGAGIYGTTKAGDIRMTHTDFDRCGYGFWSPAKFSFAAQAIMDNCRSEALGAIAHLVNTTTNRTSVVIRDNKIGFNDSVRDDFSAPFYHLFVQRATTIFEGNLLSVGHTDDCSRTLFLIGVNHGAEDRSGALSVTGNTFLHNLTATRTQQTLGAELVACFPPAHQKYVEVDASGNSPQLRHFHPATPSSQQRLITSGYAHNGTGEHSGTMPTSAWNIRNGFFQVGNFLTVSPNDSTYRAWVFKVMATTSSTITLQQINHCDAAGVPIDQAAVQAALESGASWVSMSGGQQSAVGHRARMEQTPQRPVLTTTPAAIDYEMGAVAYITLNETLEAISDISNLPVAATLTLFCVKTNAADSISLDSSNFTFAFGFTAATAAVAVGDPVVVRFTRIRQGTGANEIYAILV